MNIIFFFLVQLQLSVISLYNIWMEEFYVLKFITTYCYFIRITYTLQCIVEGALSFSLLFDALQRFSPCALGKKNYNPVSEAIKVSRGPAHRTRVPRAHTFGPGY